MKRDDDALLAVFTSTDSRDEALRIASALVQRGLVACAQVSAIDSVYVWDGALQQQGEFRLLLKTTARQYPAVEAAIRELHGYELPAIFALPVAQADAAYAGWVRRQSAGGLPGA
jgi:periplasmic divalent cation tolerance protein